MAWLTQESYYPQHRASLEVNKEDEKRRREYYDGLQLARRKEFQDYDWGRGPGSPVTKGWVFDLPGWAFRITLKGKRNAKRKLPNFTPSRAGYLISQEVIDLIEKHEPGVHKYWPTEISWKDGSPYHEKLWILVVQTRAHTLSHWELTERLATKALRPYEEKKVDPVGLIHDKTLTAGRALWRECSKPGHDPDDIFISDAFADDLVKIGSDGWELTFRTQEA
jgi:hypothetical protein